MPKGFFQFYPIVPHHEHHSKHIDLSLELLLWHDCSGLVPVVSCVCVSWNASPLSSFWQIYVCQKFCSYSHLGPWYSIPPRSRFIQDQPCLAETSITWDCLDTSTVSLWRGSIFLVTASPVVNLQERLVILRYGVMNVSLCGRSIDNSSGFPDSSNLLFFPWSTFWSYLLYKNMGGEIFFIFVNLRITWSCCVFK